MRVLIRRRRQAVKIDLIRFDFWCLTPLSAIFQQLFLSTARSAQ